MTQLHINLHNGQGLGNQLWVIFSCIGLALNTNREPIIYGAENYKGNGFVNLKVSFLKGLSPARTIIREDKCFDLIYGLNQTCHDTLQSEINNIQKNEEILLIGDLQSIHLLPDPLDRILNYIDLNLGKNYLDQNFISMHLRGGDYAKTICQPSQQYYLSALSYLKKRGVFDNQFIVTDDMFLAIKTFPEIPIKSSLTTDEFDLKRASHHQGGSIRDDFSMLLHSKASVISASTFSFWAALIGKLINKDKIIIAPLYWFANRVSKNWWSLPDSRCKYFIYLNQFGHEDINHSLSTSSRILVRSDISPKLRNIINRIIRIII